MSAIHFADQKIRALTIAFSRVLITQESNPGLRLRYRANANDAVLCK